jgi:hypothetical protein
LNRQYKALKSRKKGGHCDDRHIDRSEALVRTEKEREEPDSRRKFNFSDKMSQRRCTAI